MKTMIHDKLGECKILLEVDLNNGKCFKFVESWRSRTERFSWNSRYRNVPDVEWVDVRFSSKHRTKTGKIKPHYYALWGNSHNEYTMGITKITTPKGENVRSLSSATKKFLEIVKTGENLEFKK